MRSVNSKEEGTKRLVDRKQTGIAQVRNLTHEEENNMKTSKKFRSLMVSAAVLGMMGSSLVSTATAVMAAGETGEKVSVTIHKKDALNYNTSIDNTGEELDHLDDLKDLPGINFSIYDVSDIFYDKYLDIKDDDDMEQKAKDIIEDITNNIQTHIEGKDPIHTEDTDPDGKINASLNKYTAEDRPAVYAVVETDENMAPAQPIVFMTNIKGEGGTDLKSIHLYPKNYTLDKVMVGHEDETGEKNAVDVAVGDTLTYRVKYAIPFDIENTAYTSIKLTDTLQGADFVSGSMKVFHGDKELTDSLKPVESDNLILGGTAGELFTLTYDLSNASVKEDLASYPGQTLTVEYKVKVTNAMFADEEKSNSATLNVNGPGIKSEQEDTSIPFTTGGLQAFKYGKGNQAKGLPKAEFVLYKGTGANILYAKFDQTKLPNPPVISWVSDKENATRLESDGDGRVAISGLKYGTYTLEETKAPDGFVLPAEGKRTETFEVKKGTYALSASQPIENVPEADGSLPLTGGIGVITLIVVGGTMMAITTLRKKKED
jgi:fimbrial isopeptide formation D2 family protein